MYAQVVFGCGPLRQTHVDGCRRLFEPSASGQVVSRQPTPAMGDTSPHSQEPHRQPPSYHPPILASPGGPTCGLFHIVLLTIQIWNTAGLKQFLHEFNSGIDAFIDQESEINENKIARNWISRQSDEFGRQFGNIFPGIFGNSNLTVNLLPSLLVGGLLLLLALPLLGLLLPSLFGGLGGGGGSSK